MNKKLILVLLLCNIIGISSDIFGMEKTKTELWIRFYHYQLNEKKELKCMFLNEYSWQESEHKTKNMSEDFSNPIDCQLDLNLQHNENKLVINAGQSLNKIDATNLTSEITTLLKTNPTPKEPLFIELTKYEELDTDSVSCVTNHYRITTEIIKPQMIHVPIQVKYYLCTKGNETMEELNGIEWKPSTRKLDITHTTLRFCELKFSENTATASSLQPINKDTNKPEGGQASIETPRPEAQILINHALQSPRKIALNKYLLIEIGNDLYIPTRIEITDKAISSEQPSHSQIVDQAATAQSDINTNPNIFDDIKPVSGGFTATDIFVYSSFTILGILTILLHFYPDKCIPGIVFIANILHKIQMKALQCKNNWQSI